jgi:hypothetical protein
MSSNIKTENVRVLSKVDTAANWIEHHPILEDKEIGYERETGRYKIGNGIDIWENLEYASFGSEVGEKTLNNSEIFNDYKNNKTDTLYGHVEGLENSIGIRGFEIKKSDGALGVIYLNGVSGVDNNGNNITYAKGDYIQLDMDFHHYDVFYIQDLSFDTTTQLYRIGLGLINENSSINQYAD